MQLSQTKFESKTEARAFFKDVRRQLSPKTKAELDAAICEHLSDLINAKAVLLFYPVKGEPDLLPFANHLLNEGVRVAFPISLTDTCELDFRYIKSLEDMSVGAYGIPEPPQNAERVMSFGDCVCIVPALAFDKQGVRIGYGKGYYDRFLASANVHSVGIAYEACVCDKLPSNKNDICVDTIITEKGVIKTNAKKCR